MKYQELDYDWFAQYYDDIELDGNSETNGLNNFLAEKLKEHNASDVVDLACGTGAQTIGLAKRGFSMRPFDKSAGMLKVAKRKSKGLGLRYKQADMCSIKTKSADAVISMFNAIGQLTPEEFSETLVSARKILKNGGVFIFDIFNTVAVQNGLITHEFIDKTLEIEEMKYVRFHRNSMSADSGVMNTHQKLYIQEGDNPFEVHRLLVHLQTYTADDLVELLEEHGFADCELFGGVSQPFDYDTSSFVVCVARCEKS